MLTYENHAHLAIKDPYMTVSDFKFIADRLGIPTVRLHQDCQPNPLKEVTAHIIGPSVVRSPISTLCWLRDHIDPDLPHGLWFTEQLPTPKLGALRMGVIGAAMHRLVESGALKRPGMFPAHQFLRYTGETQKQFPNVRIATLTESNQRLMTQAGIKNVTVIPWGYDEELHGRPVVPFAQRPNKALFMGHMRGPRARVVNQLQRDFVKNGVDMDIVTYDENQRHGPDRATLLNSYRYMLLIPSHEHFPLPFIRDPYNYTTHHDTLYRTLLAAANGMCPISMPLAPDQYGIFEEGKHVLSFPLRSMAQGVAQLSIDRAKTIASQAFELVQQYPLEGQVHKFVDR